MANLGYVQVTRRCNQLCRFCSNPPSGLEIDVDEACRRIDDLADRGYDGVILTGGEPTLVPWLGGAVHHAAQRGLAPRLITNGQLLADGPLLDHLAAAGLRHVHVSLYSAEAAIHDALTRHPGSHARVARTLERIGGTACLSVDVNCVINRYNAGALDILVRFVVERFPFVRHLVFNNLDARMNRVTDNPDTIPRLADFELSLARALRLAGAHGLTFRVERVPLCYMAEWAHCSTETRKLVKNEERRIHFLDAKGIVSQKGDEFVHRKMDACASCRLEPICAGLDVEGETSGADEVYPLFLDPDAIAARIRGD